MIKTTVTYYPNDWIEIQAELAIHGNQTTCRITDIAISKGCRNFEMNLAKMEERIIAYYVGNREIDGAAQSKRRTEYEMEVEGAG